MDASIKEAIKKRVDESVALLVCERPLDRPVPKSSNMRLPPDDRQMETLTCLMRNPASTKSPGLCPACTLHRLFKEARTHLT